MLYIMMYSSWSRKVNSFIFCTIFLTFCSYETKEKENNLLKLFEVLGKEKPDKNVKAIVLIPSVGCTGCIGEAEQFMLDNIKKLSNIQFILTGINSKKAFKIRFKEVLHNSQVLIDYENITERKKLLGIYPKIYYLHKGQISKIIEASPEAKGDVWKDLKMYLQAN